VSVVASPLERVMPHLDGARLVIDQPQLRRFVVWCGGLDVLVFDRRSGVLIERWTLEPDVPLTEASARNLVEQRTRQGY